jgi:hypothetical protein
MLSFGINLYLFITRHRDSVASATASADSGGTRLLHRPPPLAFAIPPLHHFSEDGLMTRRSNVYDSSSPLRKRRRWRKTAGRGQIRGRERSGPRRWPRNTTFILSSSAERCVSFDRRKYMPCRSRNSWCNAKTSASIVSATTPETARMGSTNLERNLSSDRAE